MSAIRPSDEVADALAAGRAVVALETSVIAQGAAGARKRGMHRADGRRGPRGGRRGLDRSTSGEVVVGLSDEDLNVFAQPGHADKVARRDLPFAIAWA